MDIVLDSQGQNPRLSRLYTQLCFLFALSDDDPPAQATISSHLCDAIAKLSTVLPWISGQVVLEDGLYRIRDSGDASIFSTRDCRGSMLPYKDLREAEFPFSMLHEECIATCSTLPGPLNESAPVLRIRANFVKGGVILVVCGQHNCMDIRGQSQIISLIAKACRGEHLASEEISGNLSGWNPNQDAKESTVSQEQTSSPDGVQPEERPGSPETSTESLWAYFAFSASSLASLKSAAAEDITTGFVSTDDVLSAFVWQSVTKARLSRIPGTEVVTVFQRQVDGRKHLGIPETYIGNVVHTISTKATVRDVVESELGIIASRLRSSLQSTDIAYEIREASVKQQDQTRASHSEASISRKRLPSTNIKMSSWAKEGITDLNFGDVLGVPEAVRRPAFQAWEGLAYLLPKTSAGAIVVALSLREEDLMSLSEDATWVGHSRYVG